VTLKGGFGKAPKIGVRKYGRNIIIHANLCAPIFVRSSKHPLGSPEPKMAK